MTIRIQMSVLELSRILQPESKHSVQTDVCDPYERERQNHVVTRLERITPKCEWANVSVDGVIRKRPQTNVGEVAEHREIRHKKQQGKLKPTAVAPMVGEETEDENSGTFEMQEWSRGHGVYVASPYQISAGTLFAFSLSTGACVSNHVTIFSPIFTESSRTKECYQASISS